MTKISKRQSILRDRLRPSRITSTPPASGLWVVDTGFSARWFVPMGVAVFALTLAIAGCGGTSSGGSSTAADAKSAPVSTRSTPVEESTPTVSSSTPGAACSTLDRSLAASSTRTKRFHDLVERGLTEGCVAYVNDEATLYLEFIRGPLIGQTKTIGPTGVALFDIALTPSGLLYGVDSSSSFYMVNRETGAATVRGSGTGYFVNGLIVSSAGVVYGSGNEELVTINPRTGVGSPVGQGTGFSSSGDLSYIANGSLYMSASGDDLVRLNPKTGTGQDVGKIGRSAVYGLGESLGTLFGVGLSGELLTISPTTGTAKVISKGGPRALGMATLPSSQR